MPDETGDGDGRIYVVWSPATGPLVAYMTPEHAYMHARTMVGVDVGVCELRTEVSEAVRDDLTDEYEGDEITPVVAINDLDESSER